MQPLTSADGQTALDRSGIPVTIQFFETTTATSQQAALYHVGRKKVKTASPEACIKLYGYAPGSVPPLAHRVWTFILTIRFGVMNRYMPQVVPITPFSLSRSFSLSRLLAGSLLTLLKKISVEQV